jgi:large subunit ribosomal protein L21
MYAIIRDKNKQYRVEEGMVLDVDLKAAAAGQTLEFDEVLLLGDNAKTTVGTPTIPSAKVVAEVRGVHKGKKVEILYWRRRKAFRKHLGHRERYTRVAIKKIITGTE